MLATFLREGAKGRTAILVAFAQLADIEVELIERTDAKRESDSIALV
jgi:hypothetical protein